MPDKMVKPVNFLAGTLWVALTFSWAGFAFEDEECFICHGDPSASVVSEKGETLSLYVDQEAYAHSLHAPLGCTSCHNDIQELPHPVELNPVDCGVCHAEAEQYTQSLHGKAFACLLYTSDAADE